MTTLNEGQIMIKWERNLNINNEIAAVKMRPLYISLFRYLAGTEDGHIHRCSCSYNEQFLESYSGHTVGFHLKFVTCMEMIFQVLTWAFPYRKEQICIKSIIPFMNDFINSGMQ